MVEQADKPQATEAELQEMIAATDTGAVPTRPVA